MEKVFTTWKDIENLTNEIIRQMALDNWKPDYIVGITRGGLVPANLISQYYNLPMHTLKVSLRDDYDIETNCWMAEDAYGYVDEDKRTDPDNFFDLDHCKKILIVDDINDTGATINWIKEDWQSSCSNSSSRWENIWNNNVRIACLYDNEASKSTVPVKYCGTTVNTHNQPMWIVFPWEEFWKR